MYFLIFGDDIYRSRKKLAALRERFSAARDTTGLNERRMRAGEHNIEAVAEVLFASPFLADRKLVALHGYLQLPKQEQEQIVEMLGRKPESTVAIFHEEEGKNKLSGSPLFKALEKQKFSEEFKTLEGQDAVGFIAAECAEHEVQIEVRACKALTELIGSDSWTLHNEVEKLCAYALAKKKKMITEEMVNEMISGEREESIFAFLDACMQGRGRDAMPLLERLVASGTGELQLLSMLQKQMRTVIGVRDLLDRRVNDKQDIARRLGIHPYPAGKAMTVARNVDVADLRRKLNELVELESAFKTGTNQLKAQIGVFAARLARTE
ncbi:MAG: DNA polymerase III subunit delta [Patescibacteria group bacterium]|nr:DNA polymerase III subunit delta [Patescibacteria group bacterium]